ncbi:thioredoxin-like protein [Podospora appendiculata]|uniref:thioredoxin-dependent peroxiredoxin n=1 Tax=Podospora appendiculata TaxID=314037 RepID=A0AAE1CG36_9PEZI|nr:thioredoxin-like protein [Podospora appendiculata]
MSLESQLSALAEHYSKISPPELGNSIHDIEASFDPKQSIQPGDVLPEFSLSDATGKTTSSTELLASGPLLITFYRGGWCPYCNLALGSLQARLGEFQTRGVTLVGISPELPNTSLSVSEKNELQFPVLSDPGNELARKLGLVWTMPGYLRPLFDQFGIDLKSRNGDDSFEVPIPANLLVDGKGIVRNVYANADYRRRLEPTEALAWIDAL